MAVHGVLTDPYILTDLDLLPPIPQGGLATPYELVDADAIVPPIRTSRFPTPPSAYGFLVDDFAEDFPYDGITAALTNAVHPEGSHLEPTEGQIWPR